MDVNRRQILAGLGASLGTAVVGCGSNSSGAVDAGPDAPAPPDAAPPDAEITACTATSDLAPRELLAGIDTLVVLMMENRSFDHYLGALRFLEGRTDVDGLTGTEWNPDVDGNHVPVHLLEDFTPADPPHEWDDAHAQWNQGANDGFVIRHAGADQADVMGYHTRAQIPTLYALADQGALCHRWYCSLLGPTWPNRFYLLCGTSRGIQSNVPSLGLRSIFDRLDDAGIENLNYYHDVAWATGGIGKLGGLATIEQFFTDAAAGNLPPFTMIDPAYFGASANDDHPDHDIQLGQALISSVVAAIGQSPQWNRCLFVLTYDEHGGFYDHVAPPVPPPGSELPGDWNQYGFRVPSIVLGPTVRRGCAIDAPFEHCSIAATARAKWGIEALTARTALAPDLTPCIDPRLIGAPQPPPVLPTLKLSRRALAARQARFRGQRAHRELAAALDGLRAPRGLDRRGDTDAIVRRVLAWGERLGAVELRD